MTALARLRAEDDGVSLVELLVAIGVTTIVLAMIGSLFFTITKITHDALNTRAAVGIASNAMDELRRVIREADTNPVSNGSTTPAVVSGTATTLTVNTFVDTSTTTYAPTQVAFSLDASGNLVEQRTAAVQSNGYWVFTGAVTTQTFAGPLTAPLFAYYDGNNNPIAVSAGGLTAAQCANVSSVQVTTTVANTSNGATDPVVLTDEVGLTNLTLSGQS